MLRLPLTKVLDDGGPVDRIPAVEGVGIAHHDHEVAIFFAVLGNVGHTFFLLCKGAARGMNSIKRAHDSSVSTVLAFTAARMGATKTRAVEADQPMKEDGRK